MFRCASWPKIYDQDLKKNEKNEIEVHCQFLKTKFQQQEINNILNFNLNLGLKMVAKW
jgi:uncharacterized protein YqeY